MVVFKSGGFGKLFDGIGLTVTMVVFKCNHRSYINGIVTGLTVTMVVFK